MRVWDPHAKPLDHTFKEKLTPLLHALEINLDEPHLRGIIKARNNLVHQGEFLTSTTDGMYREYLKLMLLGRSMLFRLVGVESNLHDQWNQ